MLKSGYIVYFHTLSSWTKLPPIIVVSCMGY